MDDQSLYQRLAKHLDNLPGGFPSTPDGLEIRILKRLFNPDEADLAMYLTLLPEPTRVVAHRAKLPIAEAEQRLEEMAAKGLIYSLRHRDKPTEYMALQFVVGIWEFQLNRLNEELVRDVNEYFRKAFDLELWRKAPQLRTIPVGESICNQQDVMVYEQAEAIIADQRLIVVADCICRKERGMVGEGCTNPLETCLIFGSGAEYYLRNGLGRTISQTAALQILRLANQTGLVLQPGNSQDPGNICCCCGDCCGVLRNARLHPQPASVISSPYQAYNQVEYCTGCGECVERCQMAAIAVDNGYAEIKLDRCIGCGLCVTTCDTKALSLRRKSEAEQKKVPRNGVDSALHLARTRGKLGNRELARMLIKSKADRLIAVPKK
jgi:ferredoxin